MSRFRRIRLVEPYYPPLFVRETSVFQPSIFAFPSFVEDELPDLSFALDFFSPNRSSFEVFDSVTDLVQMERTPSFYSYKRTQRRVEPELSLQILCDRVSTLESRFDGLLNARINGGDRKYTWTEEIDGGSVDRKYKWTAEIKEGKKKEKEIDKSCKWTAKIKGKGDEEPILRTYTFESSTGDPGDCSKIDKKAMEKHKKKGGSYTRVVEIEEPSDHGAVVLRQAFAKRAGAIRNSRGKYKELSPQDAALMIQMTFRVYLIRRSQVLCALRDLAVAKTKLKEIRALFNNLLYRRQATRDAEERQKFSEKIIVLLLTVDAIEGVDLMVRAAKRSMVDELETMLDVVDPKPAVRSLSMRRRTFGMRDGVIRKEIATGVAQVVQMIDEDEKNATMFEICL